VNLAIIIAILSGLTESSDGFDYVLVVDDLMIAGYSFNLPNMRIFINTTFHKEENRKKHESKRINLVDSENLK
jgi:hypothetical protein